MTQPSLALALFPTPVMGFDLPGMDEVNRELAALLLAEEQTVPSWKRANVGGWHSVPDLSLRPEACYRTLTRAVVDHVAQFVTAIVGDIGLREIPRFRYGLHGWAMIMRDGHYVAPHDHGDAHWSVAYYVDAGDDVGAPSGRLTFLDPRRSGRTIPELPLFPPMFEVAPHTGLLVIFPGWLQHHVHPYRGTRPRICISYNATMEAVSQYSQGTMR